MHDPLIVDDQALVINVNDKGLVVISGCAHAGIVNSVKYAREIAGIDRIQAVVGGFHLTGDFFAPAIEKTVHEFKDISPKTLIPSHCTGLRALARFAYEFPGAVVENSVGTTFRF